MQVNWIARVINLHYLPALIVLDNSSFKEEMTLSLSIGFRINIHISTKSTKYDKILFLARSC